MTIQSIKMPDIGEGIAEVEVVAWRVCVGDVVAEDQILADVMTDKATVEIPSHVAGTVVSLDAAVGEVVAVGTPIIHIKTTETLIDKELSAIDKIVITTTKSIPVEASQPVAPSALPALSTLEVVSTPPPVSVKASISVSAPATDERPIAAPAVRRRAWELGIDLCTVLGTGPAGRITHADLEAATAQAKVTLAACTADTRYAKLTHEETLPVIGLRRKIAQKMQEAKRHIPHFTYVEEIDVTELEDLRTRLNAQHAHTRGRLTLLPFLIRAMVLAVRDHPEVNARYDDDAGVVTRYAAVHLGVATQTGGGLMVPVIRHAETLDLWATAAAVLQVSDAARNGKAVREDLSGSTLTLTSLGAFGGIVSTPVINRPEVAIVGTNRIVERPMIRGGAVVARKMMNLSSSFDHRVVDGLHAAEFIQHMRGYLECPGTLLV